MRRAHRARASPTGDAINVSSPAITLLGCESPMAGAVVQSVVEAGLPLTEVVVAAPAPPSPGGLSLPVARVDELAGAAEEAGIPVRYAGADSKPALHAALGRGCEWLLVACLRTILPLDTIRLARHGALNVHPSPLPAFRGPAPMFWQLRAGVSDSAVSVHALTPHIDGGRLLAQAPVVLPAGIHELAAEALAGSAVGAALEVALSRWPALNWQTQDEEAATYQGHPGPTDFRIDANTWSASRAFSFMRGTVWRGQPYPIEGAGWNAIATQPLALHEGETGLPSPEQLDARTVRLPFATGALTVRGYCA